MEVYVFALPAFRLLQQWNIQLYTSINDINSTDHPRNFLHLRQSDSARRDAGRGGPGHIQQSVSHGPSLSLYMISSSFRVTGPQGPSHKYNWNAVASSSVELSWVESSPQQKGKKERQDERGLI